ncbi:hypothetical protein [Kitasatospora griseola]|uniref:hypothetical protein n=1 Tax=Kitasatospora griseola TaxID=2064 RepID=UPI0038195827
MPATRRQLRRAALVTAVVTAAVSAESVVFALSGPADGATAVSLVALATGVLTLYWISRSLDADADRAVRGWLEQHAQGRLDQVAAETGLRPATVRLSLVRLARSAAVTLSGDPEHPLYRLAD